MFFIVLAFMVDLKWIFKIVTRKSLWRKSFKRLGVNISSLGDVPKMYQRRVDDSERIANTPMFIAALKGERGLFTSQYINL